MQTTHQPQDRRASARVQHTLTAWYRAGEPTFRRGVALDICETGARLWTETPVGEDDELSVTLKLPSGHVTLPARRVWQRPSGRSGYQVGVAFPQAETSNSRALSRWHYRQWLLQRLDRGLPA